MRKLSRACSSYIHYNGNWNDVDSELLRSGGTCAEAHNFLKDIKQYMDDMARTQVLQATDEVMNSAEMAEKNGKSIAWKMEFNPLLLCFASVVAIFRKRLLPKDPNVFLFLFVFYIDRV